MTDTVDNPRFRGLVIRKNADDLSDWVDRAQLMYQGIGVKIGYRPAILRFESGAIIRTGHLKDDMAYTKYQGHEYQRILIEELNQIPSEKRYMQLISSCRSTIKGLVPRVMGTTNPGGIGHGWVKQRWVDFAPPNVRASDEFGRKRIFIPARVDDNPTLMENDPDYVKTLDSLKNVDPELYKAWRLGSWDVFAGMVFREWNYDKHVTDRFEFSLDVCTKIITMDWGYNDPSAIHWIALTPKNKWGVRRAFVYREIHINQTEPEKLANMVKKYTDVEPVHFMVMPHDTYAHKESKYTIADIFDRVLTNVSIKRGNTLQKGARLNRVAIMHRYLSDAPDGRPFLQVHPSCQSFIKTLPLQIYSQTNVEDVDTTGDDHDYDSVSLGLITLNYTPEESTILKAPVVMPKAYPSWNTNSDGRIPAPNFWKKMGEPEKRVDPEFEQ